MINNPSGRLVSVENALKWLAYLFIAAMAYSIIVPSNIPLANPFIFGALAGAIYMDGFVIEGIQIRSYAGQPWKLFFLPAALALQFGAATLCLGKAYGPWFIEVLGIVVYLIGFSACINQVDRAVWHPE